MNTQRNFWSTVATLVVLIGALGVVLGSRSVARNDSQDSQRLFASTSASIASTLRLGIQHEQDLVDTMGAHFAALPNATQHSFALWVEYLKALQRYPELIGVAEIVFVPHTKLPAFEAQARMNPSGVLGPGGTYSVFPPGARPYYCLAKAGVTRNKKFAVGAGFDFCTASFGSMLLKSRSSGHGAYFPGLSLGNTQALLVGTPVYKIGAPTKTLTERLAAFVGWTGTELNPHTLLVSALKGHPGVALRFKFNSASSHAIFSAGTAPRTSQSKLVSLKNGWSVQISAAADSPAIPANPNALVLLLIGLALSVLMGAMMYALGTGRARALALVKERTGDLERLALHDTLTGLPNRALVLDRLAVMMARAKREQTNPSLLFLDLDNFKDINDTLGHRAGDQLLIEVAHRLSTMLRDGDTVARLGGDEFVVLGEGGPLSQGPNALAARILGSLTSPFTVADSPSPLDISASIGIAQGVRTNPEDLLRDADIAMYQAKDLGKNRAVTFVPSMQEAVLTKRELTEDLRRALDNNEFFLLYQPIVDLASGAMTGVEALLRWSHPRRGVLEPDRFVPALEETGLITPVGLWVLCEACRQGARWCAEGLDLTVAVNVSAKQMSATILGDVTRALRENSFPPELLTIELTETTLMTGVAGSVERLRSLKQLGIKLAIDDFGTGYSSIAYLRELPVDLIKIDRGFVAEIIESTEAAALVRTLIRLATDLGLAVVAEGVETSAQRNQLLAEGVASAQGFLFSAPLDVPGVAIFKAEGTKRPSPHPPASDAFPSRH